MAAFFSHLECSVPCGAGPSDPRQAHQRCTCGAPLLARYDLTAAKKWNRSTLAGRDASMWRYREILPLLQSVKGLDSQVTLGEGWTPIVRLRRLGSELRLKRLYIKDEGQNPTGSWKARGASAATTRALHLGLKTIGLAANGRAARALAAYASRAALELQLFIPKDDQMPSATDGAGVSGAKVVAFDGSLEDAERHVAELAAKEGWYDCSAGAEPYRVEGQKTIGYELAEQFGWEVPDWIICPAATGATIAGVAKAFVEMAALGWIDPVRRPHIVAVQAAGCAPLVRAMGQESAKTERWTTVQTTNYDLKVADPPVAALALKAVKESGGTAIGAGDLDMTREVQTIARLEGVSAAPGAGAALHAVRILLSEGRIKAHDTVAIINPGTGVPGVDG